LCPSGEVDQSAIAQPSLQRGAELGRFVVLGLVGRGGMGEVYAAHDPELDRKVAIKLLRGRTGRSLGDGDGATRLMREAQAIAKVSHPNVVVVYDVGTFDGRVFIAMEFVGGHTLAYWMQAQKRSLAEIVDVFIAAGKGLAAAHEKELVHRDFKPENVMVATDGQVRVMDFGLVRLAIDREKLPGETTPSAPRPPLSGRNNDPLSTQILTNTPGYPIGSTTPWEALTGNITRVGAIIGTPAYMSPEQFLGQPADFRTDQFSFCVSLYEALHGQRPFQGVNLSELAANVIAGRVNREGFDPRVPPAVQRALMRGLSVDPEARFPSMEALLAVLQQVQALSGRNRFAAGAAAKLAGIWEMRDGDSAPETSVKAEIRAAFLATGKFYAAAAFEATSRILDRFARLWTELYVDACEATHVRGEQSAEVLDLRMTALKEALEDLRALCRELRQARPEVVENAVNAANALGTLERCADVKLLRAILRPPEEPATREIVERLQVRLSEVRALVRVGRMADGLKAVAPLESEARRVGYAPLLAEALLLRGILHENVGDLDQAARTIEEAVWTAELCRHDEVAAEAAASLVFITGHVQSRFELGEVWGRHAETVLRRIGGHDLIKGWLFNNRASLRSTQGRLREALEDVHSAIAAKEKALGQDDPDVALSLGNAALYLDEMGETGQAAEYLQRSVKIMQGTLGLDHPKAAIPLTNYADLLNRLGRFDEARDTAERALAVFERETDPEGIFVTYPLAALGLSHIGTGRFADALAPLRRAVRIRETKESAPAKVAEVHFALARALWGADMDLSHALDLAARAQSEYLQAPATPATEREQAEIERWMTGKRPGR
jgi:eukaryotic-like serine/threonine-protein kinase